MQKREVTCAHCHKISCASSTARSNAGTLAQEIHYWNESSCWPLPTAVDSHQTVRPISAAVQGDFKALNQWGICHAQEWLHILAKVAFRHSMTTGLLLSTLFWEPLELGV